MPRLCITDQRPPQPDCLEVVHRRDDGTIDFQWHRDALWFLKNPGRKLRVRLTTATELAAVDRAGVAITIIARGRGDLFVLRRFGSADYVNSRLCMSERELFDTVLPDEIRTFLEGAA